MRNMYHGLSSNKSSKYPQHTKIVDQRESWKCPVCKTKHPSETFLVRPYLSVCQVFLETEIIYNLSHCDLLCYTQAKTPRDFCPQICLTPNSF